MPGHHPSASPRHLAIRDCAHLLYRVAARLNHDERFDAAVSAYRAAYNTALSLFGPEHLLTMSCLNGLAQSTWNQGAYIESRSHYERLLDATARAYGESDELHKSTRQQLESVGLLAACAAPRGVAEIALRSYFSDGLDYARFAVEQGVSCPRGERLDRDGSRVVVDRPVPGFPASIEHAPGGVHDDRWPGQAWTLMTRWVEADGSIRITRRFIDGSSRDERIPAHPGELEVTTRAPKARRAPAKRRTRSA